MEAISEKQHYGSDQCPSLALVMRGGDADSGIRRVCISFLVVFALVKSLDFFGLVSRLENGSDNIALNPCIFSLVLLDSAVSF